VTVCVSSSEVNQLRPPRPVSYGGGHGLRGIPAVVLRSASTAVRARCTAVTLPRKSEYAAQSVVESRNRRSAAWTSFARRSHTARSLAPSPAATSRTNAVLR